MKIKVITKDDKKGNKRLYFCWNDQQHPRTYSEVRFEEEYKPNTLVKCPICNMYHKVTERLG